MGVLTGRHFIMGLTVGLSLAFILVNLQGGQRHHAIRELPEHLHGDDAHAELDRLARENQNMEPELQHDEHMHHDDDSKAQALFDQVKILVWVMTGPQNLATKAKAVRDTWAKRANKVIFFSSTTDPEFPTVGLDTQEGREHLTAKTMMGFRYVHDHFINDYDWFMKADDDTYVIMENLRYFLSEQNSTDPIWFGHLFQTIVKQGYYSGGGGYVLSKEALIRLRAKGEDPTLCRQDGGSEDAELGKCMAKLGVKTANTTDAMGRSRFHCFNAETHILGGWLPWYRRYDAMGAQKGQDTISDYAISFHYVSPAKMVGLEFYIYHLRPYGIVSGIQKLNAKHPNRLLTREKW